MEIVLSLPLPTAKSCFLQKLGKIMLDRNFSVGYVVISAFVYTIPLATIFLYLICAVGAIGSGLRIFKTSFTAYKLA